MDLANVVIIVVSIDGVHIGVANQPLVIVQLRSMRGMVGFPLRW